MKRKNIRTILFMASMLLLVSCTQDFGCRKITVQIPDHPWESQNHRMWYDLRWTASSGVKNLYVSQDERSVELEVPTGQTVIICAYPLGEMNPFGGFVCPYDSQTNVLLSQDVGYFANFILDCDIETTFGLNMDLIRTTIEQGTSDVRTLDGTTFMRSILNGELQRSSFVFNDKVNVPQIAIPNGIWISEFKADSPMYVYDSISPELVLPEGVFRYYNSETDRELVMVVAAGGESFHYLKQSMMN